MTQPTSDPLIDPYNRAHTNSDTDLDVDSIHHTLGPGPEQAAPGSHDHGLAAYKSYVPRVEAGSGDWTFAAGNLKGRYQIIGKTMFLNIHMKAAPSSAPGVGQVKIYLPDRVQLNAEIDQIATALIYLGTPPAGMPNNQLGNAYFQMSTNYLFLNVYGGGAVAQVAGGNGLQQMILLAVLEIVKL